MLSSRFDINHNPAVQQVREIVLKGFEREQSAGFRKSFLTSFEEVDVHTKGGVFLGTAAQFNVEEPRLSSTAIRIVRGIHFHECKQRLTPECRIVAYVDVGFIDENGTVEPIAVNIVNRITAGQATVIDPNVFLYWRHIIPGSDDKVSVWLLLFYSRIWYLAFVDDRPSEKIEAPGQVGGGAIASPAVAE